jgi:HAD domain in Swiss Army Knife RNA repair proteins
MRVLFLDVDGVLNRATFSPAQSVGLRSWIEEELAARLDRVCQEAGAVLVMSSSWRAGRTMEELRDDLAAAGIRTPLIDVTPIQGGRRRYEEIESWLQAWQAAGDEEIESFAIVDDLHDMGPLAERFVRTSTFNGLDESSARELVRILRLESRK